jgi:hypothetical protein
MPNDINNLDTEDIGLKQIFGDRFHDETATGGAQPIKKQETTNTSAPKKTEQNGAHKRTYKDAEWEPLGELPKPVPNWLDKLKDSAKFVVGFGGLSFLLFYWEQAGLMAESIAVPCMCICTALAGWGIGKNAVGGKR